MEVRGFCFLELALVYSFFPFTKHNKSYQFPQNGAHRVIEAPKGPFEVDTRFIVSHTPLLGLGPTTDRRRWGKCEESNEFSKG